MNGHAPRFLYRYVISDGSRGTHNRAFANAVLAASRDKINALLAE